MVGNLPRARWVEVGPVDGADLQRMAMVTDPVARLDHDQVETQRQMRQERPIRQRATLKQAIGSGPDADPLPGIDGLLRQPEGATGTPANLHRDKHPGRAGIDRDQVQFMAADVDVPPEDRPTGGRQAIGDQLFGGISGLLGIGPHRCTLAATDRLWLIRLARAGLDEIESGDREWYLPVGRQIAIDSVVFQQAVVEPLVEQVERDLVAGKRPL